MTKVLREILSWYRRELGQCGQAASAIRLGYQDLAAEIRQERADNRKMNRLVTGKDHPTPRETRHAWRNVAADIDAEDKELRAIERQVVAEHEADDPNST